MIRKPLIGLVALATLVGCSTMPTTTASTKVVPERTVQAVHTQAPSLDTIKKMLPTRISASDARGKMVLPTRGQLRVPKEQGRQTHFWGSFGWGGFGTLGYGSFGLYPFSYLGSSWYYPYYLMGNSWYPFYSYAGIYGSPYSYLSYPFTYGLGCYSPYIYGLGAYGFPYGSLGYYSYAWPYSYGLYGWGWPSYII